MGHPQEEEVLISRHSHLDFESSAEREGHKRGIAPAPLAEQWTRAVGVRFPNSETAREKVTLPGYERFGLAVSRCTWNLKLDPL